MMPINGRSLSTYRHKETQRETETEGEREKA